MVLRLYFIAISWFISSSASALQFFVDPVNGDDRRSVQSSQDTVGAFKTVAHALSVAHAISDERPHVIELLPGRYSPSGGQIFPLTIDQSEIHIRPTSVTGEIIFDAEGLSNFFIFSTPISEITISGIDFYNGRAEYGGFASCSTCTLRVVENRFFNNVASKGGHVIFSRAGEVNLFNNIFRNNGSGTDTLGIVQIQNNHENTIIRDEIRNNTFYRNGSTDIWTSSNQARISSNLFINSGNSAIRSGSIEHTPLIDHNIFWETDLLYVGPELNNWSDPDTIDIKLSVRDTTTFINNSFKLSTTLKHVPDLRPLTFRLDSLSLQDLSINLPPSVVNHPDTLITVGQTYQFLIEVSGYASMYEFEPISHPEGLEILPVKGKQRLLIWSPKDSDVGKHKITMKITDSSEISDTLSYPLNVYAKADFPDTSSFRAQRDENGRFSGMYREIYTYEVPHTAEQRYKFDIDVWGEKSDYEFRPIKLPSAAFSTSVTDWGTIDWTPTLADTGRSSIEIEITNPQGKIDTLEYKIYVFENHAFPDTSDTTPLINISILPDTTNGVAQINNLSPSFSNGNSATGNNYINPVLLDTAFNRFELIVGQSPAIDAGSVNAEDNDTNGTRNNIGNYGGPENEPLDGIVLGSELEITTLPDSLIKENQTFTYDPVFLNGMSPTLVELLIDNDDPVPPDLAKVFGKAPPIKWTPTLADTGKFLVGVKVYTSDTSFGRHYFPLTVRALNQIPYVESNPSSVATEDEEYSFTIIANDSDNDAVFYQLISGPIGMTVGRESGHVKWIPIQEQVGQHSIVVRIEDAREATTDMIWTISVEPSNDAPVIISKPDTLANEDIPFIYSLAVSDTDSGDAFFPVLVTAPAGASLNNTGELNWTPTQEQIGTQQFAIIVRDQNDEEARQQFSVYVSSTNDKPSFPSFPDTIALENSLFHGRFSAADEDNEQLFYNLVEGPENMQMSNIEGEINWSPDFGDIGNHKVTIAAADPEGLSDTLTFNLEVVAVNDPPLIISQTPSNSLLLSASETILFRVIAEDEEGDLLTYRWRKNGANIANARQNSLAFGPTQGQLDSIQVFVSDEQDTTIFSWHIDLRDIPRLYVDSKQIDFGSVSLKSSNTKSASIANLGNQTLELDSLSVSNPNFDASISDLIIQDNKQSTLTIHFNPEVRGFQIDTVRFVSNDPDQPKIEIPITGHGRVGTTLALDLSDTPGNQNARVASSFTGEEIGLNLYVNDADDLLAFNVGLNFDSRFIQFERYVPESSDENNLLAKTGRSLTKSISFEDPDNISITGSIASDGVSGNGFLGTAFFKGITETGRVSTNISITKAILASYGVTLNDTLLNIPKVTVWLKTTLVGDFDLDSDVDFEDFFIFAENFGRPDFNPSSTDLNNDGTVDFNDFFIFAEAFDQSAIGKSVARAAKPADLRLNLTSSTPTTLSLEPVWSGKTPTKGFALGLLFDPDVLQFNQYLGRKDEIPLIWTDNSRPGQVTLAVGASTKQSFFENLGQLKFFRISEKSSEINVVLSVHYDGTNKANYLQLPKSISVKSLPLDLTLFPAYPNPFNPETVIEFYSPKQTYLSLTIYDLLGQEVYNFFDQNTSAGYHRLIWNGTNNGGETVAAGTYLIELRGANTRKVNKLLLLK